MAPTSWSCYEEDQFHDTQSFPPLDSPCGQGLAFHGHLCLPGHSWLLLHNNTTVLLLLYFQLHAADGSVWWSGRKHFRSLMRNCFTCWDIWNSWLWCADLDRQEQASREGEMDSGNSFPNEWRTGCFGFLLWVCAGAECWLGETSCWPPEFQG